MIFIRQMTEADIPEASRLLCASYRWLSERENWTLKQLEFMLCGRGSTASLSRDLKVESLLIANHERALVGLAAAKGNELTRLYVHPSHHRRGVGTLLYTTQEKEITKQGYSSMVATVIGPSALPFYESMGMRVVRWRRPADDIFADRKVAVVEKAVYNLEV